MDRRKDIIYFLAQVIYIIFSLPYLSQLVAVVERDDIFMCSIARRAEYCDEYSILILSEMYQLLINFSFCFAS